MHKKNLLNTLLVTVGGNSAILVRLVVGVVFLSEGIQKFLFPELVGTGRFAKIGFTDPEFWAYFTATFEIICGTLVLAGLFIRLAAVPLFIIMMTAFVTTKWPILLDKGFWALAHEYRTDFAMTVLLIFLFIQGAGNWSLDRIILKHQENRV